MKFKKKEYNKLSILFFENNAQAGAVFRLMVDAIIGLVIMGSILSILSYFEQQKIVVSVKEFENFLNSSVNSPDGKIIESGTLTFVKETRYTVTNFEALTGHRADCFKIQGIVGTAKITDQSIEFLQNTQTRVFGQCKPDSYASECPYFCTISFGRKLLD